MPFACRVEGGLGLFDHLSEPVLFSADLSARLGVIHSVVFGGFSGKACSDRIVDSGSKVLITMDAYYRSGKLLDHKEKADEALGFAEEEAKLGRKFYPHKDSIGKFVS